MFVLLLLGMLTLYLAGYGVYRCFGPVALVWPRGENLGPNEDHPSLLISIESPQRELLYHIFAPCIALEDQYHYLRHRGQN